VAIVYISTEQQEAQVIIRHDYRIAGKYITSDCAAKSEDTAELREEARAAFETWLTETGFDPQAE
jgi:hypothetical protein